MTVAYHIYKICQSIKNFRWHCFDLSQDLRPRFQKLLFPAGLPYDREKGFRTAKLGLIYELNAVFDGTKSSLVVFV